MGKNGSWCRAEHLANEAFTERMLRKRANFDVDTQLSMPEGIFHALFLYSGLAEMRTGDKQLSHQLLDESRVMHELPNSTNGQVAVPGLV